jgi:hypothetical protein
VTGSGVWDDMPVFPWSAPGDVPPAGDPAFDALLAGDPLPDRAARGLRPAAEVIAALNEAPVTGELAALASALAVFRGEAGQAGGPARSRARRHPLPGSRLSAKLAAAATAAAVTLSGAAAAAYAGALPAPVQKLAHDALGAPPARPPAHPAHPVTPVGPKTAAGHSAYGLCAAYEHLKAHGSARQKAVALRSLASAAGGTANVTAYCAAAAHPGTTATGKPAGHHPTGKPTGKPAGHPAGKSAGKSADTP